MMKFLFYCFLSARMIMSTAGNKSSWRSIFICFSFFSGEGEVVGVAFIDTTPEREARSTSSPTSESFEAKTP